MFGYVFNQRLNKTKKTDRRSNKKTHKKKIKRQNIRFLDQFKSIKKKKTGCERQDKSNS